MGRVWYKILNATIRTLFVISIMQFPHLVQELNYTRWPVGLRQAQCTVALGLSDAVATIFFAACLSVATIRGVYFFGKPKDINDGMAG